MQRKRGERMDPMTREDRESRRKILVVVDCVDDPAPCPKCGGKAIKQTYPLRPMPAAPENGEDVTDALGQVFCESCNQTYPWEYRVAS